MCERAVARVCMNGRTCLRVKCTLYEGIVSSMSVPLVLAFPGRCPLLTFCMVLVAATV